MVRIRDIMSTRDGHSVITWMTGQRIAVGDTLGVMSRQDGTTAWVGVKVTPYPQH